MGRRNISLFQYARFAGREHGGVHAKALRDFTTHLFKTPIVTDRRDPKKILGVFAFIEEDYGRNWGMVCVGSNHPRHSQNFFPIHMWGYILWELERGSVPQYPVPILDPDRPDTAFIVPHQSRECGNYFTIEVRAGGRRSGGVTVSAQALKELAERVRDGRPLLHEIPLI